LTDAQITQVVLTVDKGETELGKLAKVTSKNPEVKKFADDMIQDHTESQLKAINLSKKLAITPMESEQSMMVKKDGDQTKAKLMNLKGKDFDKAYIDSMVQAHQKVLNRIDNELLPEAKNEDLKAMLQTKRTSVSQHLNHAKAVQTSI
jgi:putative membrane protein